MASERGHTTYHVRNYKLSGVLNGDGVQGLYQQAHTDGDSSLLPLFRRDCRSDISTTTATGIRRIRRRHDASQVASLKLDLAIPESRTGGTLIIPGPAG